MSPKANKTPHSQKLDAAFDANIPKPSSSAAADLDPKTRMAEESPTTPDSAPKAQPSPSTAQLHVLERKLAEKEQELSKIKDLLLRSQAEQENVRERARRDVQNAHDYGLKNFANELLAAVDSLERGLENCDADQADIKAMHEGMQMTLNLLLKAFEKHHIRAVDPTGEAFDPDFHEAISTQVDADAKPNTVCTVVQKGYTVKDRLIRPALVIVSKAS